MKTLNLLKKEYPELNLKLGLVENILFFSGNWTPVNLIGKGEITLINMLNFLIRISSEDCPEIRVEESNYITLFIGGREHNDLSFITSKNIPISVKENLISLFKTNLNKQITIL
jgi:hypothetical protein